MSTVNHLREVGKGTGPTTSAPVEMAVSKILRAASSITRWSYALSLTLMELPEFLFESAIVMMLIFQS